MRHFHLRLTVHASVCLLLTSASSQAFGSINLGPLGGPSVIDTFAGEQNATSVDFVLGNPSEPIEVIANASTGSWAKTLSGITVDPTSTPSGFTEIFIQETLLVSGVESWSGWEMTLNSVPSYQWMDPNEFMVTAYTDSTLTTEITSGLNYEIETSGITPISPGQSKLTINFDPLSPGSVLQLNVGLTGPSEVALLPSGEYQRTATLPGTVFSVQVDQHPLLQSPAVPEPVSVVVWAGLGCCAFSRRRRAR